MTKTTVYLSDDLEQQLDIEAANTGVSKAELIRRGIAMLLDAAPRHSTTPLPTFTSGSSLSARDMDEAIAEQIQNRAA